MRRLRHPTNGRWFVWVCDAASDKVLAMFGRIIIIEHALAVGLLASATHACRKETLNRRVASMTLSAMGGSDVVP